MVKLCSNMRLDFGLVRSQVLIKMGGRFASFIDRKKRINHMGHANYRLLYKCKLYWWHNE